MSYGGNKLESTEIISGLGKMLNKEDIVVTEFGYISNIMHQLADRDRNFYLLEDNVDPISLGLGIASARKEKTFVFISETTFQDKLSSLKKITDNKPNNLIIIMFNFQKYEQYLEKQVFSSKFTVELHKISKGLGIRSFNITKTKELKAILKKIYGKSKSYLLELMMNKINIEESLHELDFKDLRDRFKNSLK